MSYAASLYDSYNPPVMSDALRGISREQGWLSGTFAGSAPSQHETEAWLVMDRLLRQCLTRKIDLGDEAATVNLRNLHIVRRGSAV